MVAFKGSAGGSLGFGAEAPMSFAFGGNKSEGAPGFLDKLSGFGQSTIASFPELFGIEPTEAVQTYRAQNPVAGFASQALGAFVPYIGAAKLARAVPLIDAGITAAGALPKSAIGRGAATAAAEALAVETGRVALGSTPIPEMLYEGVTGRDAETRSPGQLAGEAIFNVAGSGILGGAVGGLAARFAKGRKISDFVVGAAPDRPLPLQIRALEDVITQAEDPAIKEVNLSPDALARLQLERDQRIKFNLLDVEPTFTDSGETVAGPLKANLGKAYRKLVGDRKNDPNYTFLNRMNSGWQGKNMDRQRAVRRLYYDPNRVGTYHDEADFLQDISALGVSPKTLGTWAQDVKTIEIKAGAGKPLGKAKEAEAVELPGGALTGERLLQSPQEWNATRDPRLSSARGIQRRFQSKPFKDVGDGWKMAEDESGFFVLAKKIRGEAEAAPGDRWAIMRTDRPDVFNPRMAAVQNEVQRSGYFVAREALEAVDEPLYQAGRAILRQSENSVDDLVKPRKTEAGAMARDVLETARTYVQPTGPLAQRNKVFAQGYGLLKELADVAEERVTTLLKGRQMLDPKKTGAGNVLALGNASDDGLEAGIKKLTQADLDDIRYVLEEELPIEKVRELNARADLNGDKVISDDALALLDGLQFLSDGFEKRIGTLAETVRVDSAQKLLATFQARKGHYGITRDFPGAYRIYLNDAQGEAAGIASGKDWLDAEKQAGDLIAYWAKRGKPLTLGGRIDEALRSPEELQALKARIIRPGFIKNRGDLLGYELQRGDMTHKKLTELVATNLRRRENFLRDVVADDLLAPLRDTLTRQSPQDAMRLEKARKIMSGDEGPFAKAQNAIMDKTLASVGLTGKDSASNIVRATQSLITNFQFNFGNLTQPVTNMLGIMQTLLPQISFVVHASPETLARSYASLPLVDGQGSVKGTLGMLSEVKVLKNAFQRIGQKLGDQPQDYQELLDHMVKQRVLAPRFAEAEIGVDGAILRDPIAAFKSAGSFVDYMQSANTLLMSKSEELSRLVTINAAYDLAKLMGLDGKRMATFTRDMVARTNYNYGAMDRALVFTTPVGSLAGTFKNWIFHYMSSMLQFATGGKETLPALFWQTAATGLIGGAVATPLAVPMADAASKFFTDKKFMENLYATTGSMGLDERVADGIMYGLPGAMGVSLASQVASPGSDPQRDAQMIFGFAALDRAKALSRGTRDALVAYRVSGESPWEDENVRKELIRALAPRTLYRSMALSEDLAVQSLATGYDVTQPMGLGSALLYGAGFSPVELDKTYAVYNEIRNDQRKQKDTVKELGQTLAQAWETEDDRLANRVFTRAMAIGVDTSSVLRSAEARAQRQEETQLEFVSEPEDQERYGFMFDNQ